MSVRFVAVNWNRQKRIYDGLIALGVVGAVAAFTVATFASHPHATIETALIRGLGFTAFLLLTLILAIGPATRLDRRFLPLLYNRRHLGVTVGLLGLAHGGFAVFQYHALGNIDPLAGVLSIPALGLPPFEWFGIATLLILFLMAATSHDFWLSALTPPVWKRLHMLVYPAYLSLLLHLGLGFLHAETGLIYKVVIAGSAAVVGILHVAAAVKERRVDRSPGSTGRLVDLCAADAVPEGRAIIGMVAGERVAVFRHEGRLSCVSNVCKHQNGPLGEGKIIDGCITCPWHGYQYRPDSGTSPPPFNDSIPTFNLTVENGRVLIDSVPNPPGTRVEPVSTTGSAPPDREPFYVGYQPKAPAALGRFSGVVAGFILTVALGVMVVLAVSQTGYDVATFEYGAERSVEGVVRAEPFPLLEVARPGSETVSRYLLAAAGKRGAQAAAAEFDGQRVKMTGVLAYRDNLTVLEFVSAVRLGQAPTATRGLISRGAVELTGEIVDSKCYAGVMNPGRGATHRGCAVRCLAGGLTPLFVVTGRNGPSTEMVVTDRLGKPLPDVARWAGRPVRVRGNVEVVDDLWFIRLDQREITPLQ